MKGFRLARIVPIFLIVLSLLPPGYAAENERQITILHTNDMHSQYAPFAATWIQKDPRPLVGGMVALEYFVKQERSNSPHTLLLDAGDVMTGTPLSKIMVDGAFGGGFIKMMNLVGYDAGTIGNHEFDEGQANLHKLIALADHDVLCANLYDGDSLFAPKAYEIYNVGSVRVGVIGMILEGLAEVTSKKNLAGLRIDDIEQTAQKIIDQIDDRTDLIVLLTHQGVDEDVALADKLRSADVIVGGHSHTRLSKAIERNRMIIVQTGSITSSLGKLTIEVKGDSVASYDYKLIPLMADEVKQPNRQMAQLVESYQKEINEEYGQVIGTLKTDWKRSSSAESNIGNYMTDVIRETTQADFALLNSGGIRKDLVAGPITRLNIIEILPFTNYLVKFICTGEQLMNLIKQNIATSKTNQHGILQMSGIKFTYRADRDGNFSVVSAQVNGQKIDPRRDYMGVTVDFVMDGLADRYVGAEIKSSENTGLLLSDVVLDYIIHHPKVDARIEGRMKKVKTSAN